MNENIIVFGRKCLWSW